MATCGSLNLKSFKLNPVPLFASAVFQVLKSHMWLVAAVFDSTYITVIIQKVLSGNPKRPVSKCQQ